MILKYTGKAKLVSAEPPHQRHEHTEDAFRAGDENVFFLYQGWTESFLFLKKKKAIEDEISYEVEFHKSYICPHREIML